MNLSFVQFCTGFSPSSLPLANQNLPSQFSDMLLYTSKGVTATNQFKVHGQLPLHGMLVSIQLYSFSRTTNFACLYIFFQSVSLFACFLLWPTVNCESSSAGPLCSAIEKQQSLNKHSAPSNPGEGLLKWPRSALWNMAFWNFALFFWCLLSRVSVSHASKHNFCLLHFLRLPCHFQ